MASKAFTMLVLAAVAVSCCAALDPTTYPIPKYTVDLDLAPYYRWQHIAKVYSTEIKQTLKFMNSFIPAEIRPQVDSLVNDIGLAVQTQLGVYASEMQGIADVVGIPHGDVVLVNLLYEITAKCTSTVAQHTDGTIYHGRNLDFGEGGAFTDFLRSIAIEVHFQRNGTTVYTGTTYSGYVGLPTATRPGYWSVSVDEVVEGPIYAALISALNGLMNPNAQLMTLLIRDIMENSTFSEAVQTLGYHDLVSPVFFIMGGVQPGEGVVITRARNKPIDFWWLDADHGLWYLVETNYDHWVPPPEYDDRLDPMNDCMNAMGQANLSVDNLYNCLSTPPVLNPLTTYTAIIINSQSYYRCNVRRCC
jgi:N-acylethanolamine-hydrolysing acid amidase